MIRTLLLFLCSCLSLNSNFRVNCLCVVLCCICPAFSCLHFHATQIPILAARCQNVIIKISFTLSYSIQLMCVGLSPVAIYCTLFAVRKHACREKRVTCVLLAFVVPCLRCTAIQTEPPVFAVGLRPCCTF